MFENIKYEWHGRFYGTIQTSRGVEIAPIVSLAMKTVLGIEDPGVTDLILRFACDDTYKYIPNPSVRSSRGVEIAPTVSLAMKTVLGIEDPGVTDLILHFACDEAIKADQNVQWFKEEWEMSRDEAWGRLGVLYTVNGTTLVGTAECGMSRTLVPFKFEMVESIPADWSSDFRGSSSGRTYSPDEVLWHVTVLPEYEWFSGAKNLDEYGIASSITSVLDEYACPVVA